jgi:hypothetical protein
MLFVDNENYQSMNQYILERGANSGLHPLEQMLLTAQRLLCASEPDRIKHISFRRELSKRGELEVARSIELRLLEQLYEMVPEVAHERPEIEEDHIKKESFIGQSDKRISVLKGHRGKRAAIYAAERRQLQPDDHEGLIRWLGGVLDISYANDVMTSVMVGDKEWKEFKPKEDASKDDIYAYLRRTIGTQNPVEGDTVQTRWYTSLSLHEEKTDVQVVRQEQFDLVQQKAPDSFLHALIYGIYDPKHPVNSFWAWKFMELYEKGTSYSSPNSTEKPHRHKQNWGGWTPEEGMPIEALRKVNAGRRGDSIPFIEYLLVSVNGVQKGDPTYPLAVADAIKAVRGKAVRLPYLLRRLLETIAELPTPKQLDMFVGDPEFVELARQLWLAQEDGRLPKEWNYTGRTRDVSGSIQPIDSEKYIPFILSLLGMREKGVDRSGIIH